MSTKQGLGDRNTQASLSAKRNNFIQSKQKKKDFVQAQNNSNYESNVSHGSNERIATKDLIESLETHAQVGAFAIAGIHRGIIDVDETEFPDSRLSMAQPSQDATSVEITSARVVDDFIVDATILEEVPKNGLILKYTLIAIVTLLLLIAIIVPTIILTRQSQNNSPILDTEAAANAFLEKLKPLLTNSSRQELERPGSSQKFALDWLLNETNYSAYSFDRQVQRFAMAAFFFSTGGTSWKKTQSWVNNDDECTWYQSGNGTVCVNGTLQMLSLRENALKGLLPNDIALLNSLTYLDLSSNSLDGSIPSEIGALTKLIRLDLSSNALFGSIPSEIGDLTKLTELFLYFNALSGSIPSEIGALTTLTRLDLSFNALTGSIPESLCNQSFFALFDENVTCSCCK